MKQTLYDILEIAPDASFEDIEIAYTKRFEVLRAETSFDSNRLVMLNEAREVLSDPGRRAAYDASLAAAAKPELRFQSVEVDEAPRSSGKWMLIGVVFAVVVIWWSMRDDAPVLPVETQSGPSVDATAEASQSEEIVVTLPASDRSEVEFPFSTEDEELESVDASTTLEDEEPDLSAAATPPAAVAAATAAPPAIIGYWDCYEPVTGRTSEYGFGADGKLTIQPAVGEAQTYAYTLQGGRINLTDADPPLTIGVEELASRKLVLGASGIAQRVVCAR